MYKSKSSARLISQLDNIVDSTHIEEVKQVIDALTKVNEFKYSLTDTTDIAITYKKITDMLSNEFNIKHFKIIQIVNNIETIQYKTDDDIYFDYTFSSNISENGTIQFLLNNSSLSKFNKIYLDNYLEEISHILYVQLVLTALQESAHIDSLTKLKNRLSFNEDMQDIIPLALRENMKIGVLLINIDRFRAVNDEHGTEFGDEFLRLYAKTIKDTIRTSDIAIRFGGGEFLVLLMNVIDEDKTMEISNNLKDKLADTYLITKNKDEFKKTVCVGVSMFPSDSSDIHEVVKNAEMILSDARDSGRNKVLRYIEDDGELDLF